MSVGKSLFLILIISVIQKSKALPCLPNANTISLEECLKNPEHYIRAEVKYMDGNNEKYGFDYGTNKLTFQQFLKKYQKLSLGTTLVFLRASSEEIYKKFIGDLNGKGNWTGIVIEGEVFKGPQTDKPPMTVDKFQPLVDNLPRTVSAMISSVVTNNAQTEADYDDDAKKIIENFKLCRTRQGVMLDIFNACNSDFLLNAMKNYHFIVFSWAELNNAGNVGPDHVRKIIKIIKQLKYGFRENIHIIDNGYGANYIPLFKELFNSKPKEKK